MLSNSQSLLGSSVLDATLLRNLACVCDPAPTDARHIVMAGGKIIGLLSSDAEAEQVACLCNCVLDGCGLLAAPGLIDLHEHVAGGGGEAGPSSRTPEAQLSQLLRAGITTVVGTLGTDSVTRSAEALLAKCRGLEDDGVTALHWGGSGYRYPPGSLTGSPQRDVALLEGCVGVGEVAISDHRGSFPSALELARLAAEVRVGGMLRGRPALVHCHVGAGVGGLQPLRDALAAADWDLPITQFLPTHVERNELLWEDAARWLDEGGRVDLTADPDLALPALALFRRRGLPLARCTLSSDAYGSLPRFDPEKRLVGYDVASPGALLDCVRALAHPPCDPQVAKAGEASQRDGDLSLEEALALVTRNPAEALGLGTKGRLRVGADADVALFDPGTLELRYVVAGGEVVKTPEWVRGGQFERGPGIRPRKPRLASQL